MNDLWTTARRAAPLLAMLLAFSPAGRSQTEPAKKSVAATVGKKGASSSPKISLSPRFIPGQTFRYEIESETATDTKRSGIASDPEGPSSLVIVWNATVRVEVLPDGGGTPGAIRLRCTYEKSTATIRSDTFDPQADVTKDQYQKLEGKVVEFVLDAGGKVKSISGVEAAAGTEKAAQAAREWIAQLGASAGTPPGGVSVGQSWSSEQAADSLPIAGLVWRTESQYLRNEACRPANSGVPPAPGAADSMANANAAPDCAVILSTLNLIHGKYSRDPTPPEYRKNNVQSSGKWNGAGQSLLYVSLASGMVVSVTQSGKEEMDVLLTSNHNTSMRYFGTIQSRSEVTLLADIPASSDRDPKKP